MNEPEPSPELPDTPLALRVTLVVGGVASLGLGILGIVLPLLPATPFILLAAGCFARAWPAAHRWVLNNEVLGPICRAGQEGRYLPPRAKRMARSLAPGRRRARGRHWHASCWSSMIVRRPKSRRSKECP